MTLSASPNLIIWRFTDGKAGHDSQSRGLALALKQYAKCDVHDFPVRRGLGSGIKTLLGQNQLPPASILLGAGHNTHFPILCARLKYGGKAIVLMRPSLPGKWFDYCFIPEHDRPSAAANIISTKGALNTVTPAQTLDSNCGLILIGGESRHFSWNQDVLEKQIVAVLTNSSLSWNIADSPRTPPATRNMLASLVSDVVRYVPYESTAPLWLPEQLQKSATVWVSQDSISMIYESLSAGGAVGIFDLPIKKPGRISQGIQKLVENDSITMFSHWKPGEPLKNNPSPLQEADRCAKILLERLSIKHETTKRA